MARITIDDLEEDQELDAAAMKAIFGGKSQMRPHLRSPMKLGVGYLTQTSFVESNLIPGLIKVKDLRQG